MRIICILLFGLLSWGLQAQDVEVGFAAKGADLTAKQLVLKVINSAKSEIRMECYNFTDPDIINALVAAKTRGVDVQIAHDYTASTEKGDGTPQIRAANIPIHLIRKYKIMHDKVLVVDRIVVETGSFNYSTSATRENAENVIVLWSRPDVAKTYLTRWQSLFNEGQ